jgi:uncharacterized membrane protein YphA (DoxX/SURF4 family)
MPTPKQYACATIVLLVLLRLAIGWHFMFEGVEKLKSPSWSSETYLRESTGPLAPFFRKIAGDSLADRLTPRPVTGSEDAIGERLSEFMPPALDREWQLWYDAFLRHYKLPLDSADQIEQKLQDLRQEVRELAQNWRKLDDQREKLRQAIKELQDEKKRSDAEFKQAMQDRDSLEKEVKNLEKSLKEEKDAGEKRRLTALKENSEDQIKALDSKTISLKNKDDEREKIVKGKADELGAVEQELEKLSKQLNGLQEQDRKLVERQLADLRFKRRKEQTVRWLRGHRFPVELRAPAGAVTERTAAERIEDYRTLENKADQLAQGELHGAHDELSKAKINSDIRTFKQDATRIRTELRAELNRQTTEMQESVREVLGTEYLTTPRMPDTVKPSLFKRDMLGWVDTLVPLGLVMVGACLLLGFLTRTGCVLGALLLLSFYLAMPPWPGGPENPRAEGHYLFINKNVIEMLALLVLATTPSGRWAGLDRVLHSSWVWWKSRPRRQRSAVAPQRLSELQSTAFRPSA